MRRNEQVKGNQAGGRRFSREDWRGALRGQVAALLIGLGILGAGYWLVSQPGTARLPAVPPLAGEMFPASPPVALRDPFRVPHRPVAGQRMSFTWTDQRDM
jgi:hypothetical protein